MTQYANIPKPYTMKFIIMVWFAFLARQRPVSTNANPACMNMTRKPVTNVHTKLIAIRFWPIMLTVSASVRPFLLSETTISLTVPVSVPPGSPLAKSSFEGPVIAAKAASVIGTGAAVGFAAGEAAAGACANETAVGIANPASQIAAIAIEKFRRTLVILVSIDVCLRIIVS